VGGGAFLDARCGQLGVPCIKKEYFVVADVNAKIEQTNDKKYGMRGVAYNGYDIGIYAVY
jgi:hypothetical protein